MCVCVNVCDHASECACVYMCIYVHWCASVFIKVYIYIIHNLVLIIFPLKLMFIALSLAL